MTKQAKPVLVLGGSGQVGTAAAATLRRWHPTLPLTIAGRDLDRAQCVADELGEATAVMIDLQRGDLGLAAEQEHSAVVAALWDERLHGLRYAQARRLPYLSISSGLVDIAPEVVESAQQPGAAPVLLASHFGAGVGVLATLLLARDFDRVDTVRVGAILDETDTGGPAAAADLERLMNVASAGLVRRDGAFAWIAGSEAEADVLGSDGVALPGQSIATLDVPSLASATGAPNVRFDFAVGESPGRRRGERSSFEARIELEGTDSEGAPLRTTRVLVHPAGQNPLTGLGVALGVESLLGLRGEAPAPGIHTPEGLIDPAYAVQRLIESGATFVDGQDGALASV